MWALFKKEINSFFSSLIGYIVISVFLVVNAIFLWLVPDSNLLDYGYADLRLFFENAPYIFLLLIPAITMRSFAEEKNLGTLESIITKPVSEVKIILAKYLAALVLVVFAILPTITYYITLYKLGNPVGNIDTGAVIGSYIGLALLASVYVAIGVFASAITDSQIVALLVSVILCLLVSEGFQLMAGLRTFKSFSLFWTEMGVLNHYVSMSRGVIDTRDLIYFISANAFFLLGTKTMLQKRKW